MYWCFNLHVQNHWVCLFSPLAYYYYYYYYQFSVLAGGCKWLLIQPWRDKSRVTASRQVWPPPLTFTFNQHWRVTLGLGCVGFWSYLSSTMFLRGWKALDPHGGQASIQQKVRGGTLWYSTFVLSFMHDHIW